MFPHSADSAVGPTVVAVVVAVVVFLLAPLLALFLFSTFQNGRRQGTFGLDGTSWTWVIDIKAVLVGITVVSPLLAVLFGLFHGDNGGFGLGRNFNQLAHLVDEEDV